MNNVVNQQQGFSLPEVLLATLLLSVSVLGLLQYYQSLGQGFSRQWQMRQAWQEAHEQLESYAATGKGKVLSLAGWQAAITQQATTPGCQRITASVVTPLGYKSTLSRWLCQPVADSGGGIKG